MSQSVSFVMLRARRPVATTSPDWAWSRRDRSPLPDGRGRRSPTKLPENSQVLVRLVVRGAAELHRSPGARPGFDPGTMSGPPGPFTADATRATVAQRLQFHQGCPEPNPSAWSFP